MTKPRDLGELVSTGGLFANGTLVVSDVSDLTASAAELNIMAGMTASTAEINYLDGVTAPIQDQFNGFLSVTLSGPAPGNIFVGSPTAFTITNYDFLTTYTLSTTNGTVTRSGETITYTPSSAGPGGFVVNGRSITGYTILANAGQQQYTTAGTYSWVAPSGITNVSVVCVGGGGASIETNARGGGGGGLGWKNNISVSPGSSYTVVVGAGGASGNAGTGEQSYFNSPSLVAGGGGTSSTAGTYIGDGGGNGGIGGTKATGYGGGGGAGGYTGNGGAGGNANGNNGSAGSGGGSGGGGGGTTGRGAHGGGTGILGQGADGAAGTFQVSGGDGSQFTGSGAFGRGGLQANTVNYNYPGGVGAVRIIWAGDSGVTRAFPSTNTGNL